MKGKIKKLKCPKCGSNNVLIDEVPKYDPQDIFGFTIMDYAKIPNRSCINCRHVWRELKYRKNLKNKEKTGSILIFK